MKETVSVLQMGKKGFKLEDKIDSRKSSGMDSTLLELVLGHLGGEGGRGWWRGEGLHLPHKAACLCRCAGTNL